MSPGGRDIFLPSLATRISENEIYVKYGAIPTPEDYDFAAVAKGPNQYLALSSPALGTYYIAVRAVRVWRRTISLYQPTRLTWHVLTRHTGARLPVGQPDGMVPGERPAEECPERCSSRSKGQLLERHAFRGAPASQRGASGSEICSCRSRPGRGQYCATGTGWAAVSWLTASTLLPPLSLNDWTTGRFSAKTAARGISLICRRSGELRLDMEAWLYSNLELYQGSLSGRPVKQATGAMRRVAGRPAPGGTSACDRSAWVGAGPDRDHLIHVGTTAAAPPWATTRRDQQPVHAEGGTTGVTVVTTAPGWRRVQP